MKNITIAFIGWLTCLTVVCAQNNSLVINNAYIVFSGGALATPATVYVNQTNGLGVISRSVTGGIISEAEFNQVKWYTGATEGQGYTIPFVTGFNVKVIPFTLTISVAGTETATATGNIKFSTYGTGSANTAFPSGVTNLNYKTGADNSLFVADRWWIIDADGYSTKPTPIGMLFTYSASAIAAPNTINESALQAQRFDAVSTGTNSGWDGFAPAGAASGAPNRNVIISTSVSPSKFARIWVLVDNNMPLPIELLSFNGLCNNGKVNLTWSTASETNNDFFTIEKSADGINFQFVTTVDGAGNSTQIINYAYTDKEPLSGKSYYRLKQTDFDGEFKYSRSISVEGCDNDEQAAAVINAYSNGAGSIFILINSVVDEKYNVSLFDVKGSRLTNEQKSTSIGRNEFFLDISHLAKGIYLITIQNETKIFTKKILLI